MSHAHHQFFRFYANGDEFFPPAGTRIAFKNRGVDTVTFKGLDSGTLSPGDEITVTFTPIGSQSEQKIFAGTVESLTESDLPGTDSSQDAVASSPWSKLDRLVYQQQWGSPGGPVWSSGLVLNQSLNGAPIGFKDQLNDILTFAASRCGFDFDHIAGGQVLPFDEIRDLTCAQAMNRVLRWFPKTVVRFDYSGETPELELAQPAAASWTASIDKSSVVRTLNAHPVSGVCVETVTTGETEGVPYRVVGNQVYPTSANPSGVDILHVTVSLAGTSGSNTYETFSTHCDDDIDPSSPGWWKKYHPRLSKVAVQDIQIKEHSFRDDMANYPRKADCSVEELVKFGLKARVETFTARVSVKENGDGDREEDMVLQMKFVTTNAKDNKVYRRLVGSTSTSGESIPEGLAQAIYEDRSGTLQAVDCTAVLGAAFPKLGETYEGLILQSFEVDPLDLTVECHFGQPEHLSADDMAGLLTGFRNRSRSTSCWERQDGKKGGDDDDAPKVIAPIESTEFCPGVKSKTTIKSSSGGGTINLDAGELKSGDELKVREITISGEGDKEKKVKVLATENFTAGGVKSVNGTAGALTVKGGDGIEVSTQGKTITISYKEGKEPDADPESPASPSDEQDSGDKDPCDHDKSGNEGGVRDPDGGGLSGGGGGGGGGVPAGGDSHNGDNDCTHCK